MSKLIAVHFLHLAGATAGLIDIVQPGQAFVAREDELYLAESGAARAPTAEDKHATLAVRSASSAALSAPAEDLSKLTKADLIALAAAEEIAVDGSASNKVIIKAIEDGRAAKNDGLI
jgi:hypothetical protein